MNAHWILRLRKYEGVDEFISASYRCSNCHSAPIDTSKHYPLYERYCHECGAHMIEEPIIEIENYNNKAVYYWE